MNKKVFKRTAAFVVSSLMLGGIITVLPDEYLPQIGIVSAEETAAGNVAITPENFPDEIFMQYVSDNFDTDNNGLLSDEEISQIRIVDVQDSGVQSCKGIEFFPLLTRLTCSENQLKSLDVSNNTALTILQCSTNQLTSLDVSNNTALTWLECDDNQLSTLDVSNNTLLTNLMCHKNQLTSLDVSSNTVLKSLMCQDNQITSLDVSNNTALTLLWCNENKLTSLDVNNNTMLDCFICDKNQLTSLDVTNNTMLTILSCSYNQITSIDVSNNAALTNFSCDNNQLVSLDISNNPDIINLYCHWNQLTSLDVSNNTALEQLVCDENKLISLDVSNNTALTYLRCEYNRFTTFDVSNNTALTWLYCYGNQLTSLDVSNNPLITEFNCNCFYNIGKICGVYDLKNLPVGFDISKTSNWQGATLKDDMLTEIDGTLLITYDYDCGNNHTATFKLTYDLVDHTYDDGVITIEPTEQTEGEKTFTCTNCGETKTEVIEKLEHVHNNGDELMSDATGHWYTCSGCDEKLDYATHTEDDGTVTVEPTETTEGQKVYKCTVCGYTTRTDVVAKLEHVHDQGDELMSDATGHWYTCSGCDEKLDYATHTEDDGTVTVEPTETTEGQKVYKCTVCGYTTRTDVVAKLEHVHNKGDELMCDATGHWYTCSGCDEKLDFSAHTEDDGTVTVEPTETTEGQKVYKCTVCGYTTKTEIIAKLENGNTNPSIPSQPSQPTNPTQPQQPEENETEINIDAKKGWGNVVKEINAANENSKINVDMGNATEVPKNVLDTVQGKDIDVVLDMGDGITWTINGKDVTDPQSIDLSVTKKKNSIPEDMISDPANTVPLVLAHNGSFGCSATLSIDLSGNDKKFANLYYYNTKTKELEFVDSCEITNGKANLVFTHASDWAIIISDTFGVYEDISSAAGVYEADDNSQTPLCMIVIIIAVVGFSSIIIVKRFAKNKH